MDCAACRPRLAGFLDGALPAAETQAAAAHLASCAACREHLAGLERVDRALESLPAPAPPAGYLDELRERVAARIAAAPGWVEGSVGAGRQRAAFPFSTGGWLRFVPIAAAALVAVAVLRFVDLRLPGAVEMAERRAPAAGGSEVAADRETSGAAAPAGEAAPARTPAAPDEPTPAGRAASAETPTLIEEGSRDQALPQEKAASGPAAAFQEDEPRGGTEEADAAAAEREGMHRRAEPAAWGQLKSAAPKAAAAGAPGDAAGLPELSDAEALIGAGRFARARSLLDSLAVAATGGDRLRASNRVRTGRSGSELPTREVAVRLLVGYYAALADSLGPTGAGRSAAGRSARLALDLFAVTGEEDDCRLALTRTDAYLAGVASGIEWELDGFRHPLGEIAADSIAAGSLDDSLAAERRRLPCAP